MPKFLIVMKGDGDGCDYTIGCNMRYRIVERSSYEEAVNKAVNEHVFGGEREHCEKTGMTVGDGDLEIVQLLVIPYDPTWKVDLDKIRNEHNRKAELVREGLQREKDLAQLEALTRKLGMKSAAKGETHPGKNHA